MIKTLISFIAVPPFHSSARPTHLSLAPNIYILCPSDGFVPDPVQAKENLLTSTSATSISASCLPCLIFLVTTSLYPHSFLLSQFLLPAAPLRSLISSTRVFCPLSTSRHSCPLPAKPPPLWMFLQLLPALATHHNVLFKHHGPQSYFLTPSDEQEGAQGSSLEHTSTLNPPQKPHCCSEILTTAFQSDFHFSHFFISL